MWIEFIRGWRNYPRGRSFDIADGMANELLRRGLARRVADPAMSVEMAVDRTATMAEAAARRTKRRKR